MRSLQQFSVTLTIELADHVRAKVASGEYPSESEVIKDGLRALQASALAAKVGTGLAKSECASV
jgi:putative addiction module CopG family antidote